ncbi:MAG: radical SAM family heme chaperone HemW [Ignavibacteriae bacterium]|nr:radical SAM family heme chaperone HemW [Ignavibacteriota bacterium]NOG99948.1 radical SAM family heme chaperone HemW [Ignavibacteriota bacterium]
MKKTSIYIHIPFCDHKCIYCDFYSIIKYDDVEKYFYCLKKEIAFYAQKFSEGRIITSVFLGGGTPSFVNSLLIENLITELKKNFNVSEKAEITIESNPGTMDEKKINDYLEAGINRLSIGVQSFNDEELKFMTRIHDSRKALETINLARREGFKNISIDLIFNLPKQTKNKWLSNLEIAADLPIEHISAYSLMIERGTILNKMILDGKVKIMDSDFDAELYEITIDYLSGNNFLQYEVSNFCREGYECSHNLGYWNYNDYISIGTSAHSFVNGKRWWNFSPLNLYISAVEKNGHAEIGNEILSDKEKLNEFVMLALRSKGLNINDLTKFNDKNWFKENEQYLTTLKNENLISIKNNFIKFTKHGYAICDEIISKFQ